MGAVRLGEQSRLLLLLLLTLGEELLVTASTLVVVAGMAYEARNGTKVKATAASLLLLTLVLSLVIVAPQEACARANESVLEGEAIVFSARPIHAPKAPHSPCLTGQKRECAFGWL